MSSSYLQNATHLQFLKLFFFNVLNATAGAAGNSVFFSFLNCVWIGAIYWIVSHNCSQTTSDLYAKPQICQRNLQIQERSVKNRVGHLNVSKMCQWLFVQWLFVLFLFLILRLDLCIFYFAKFPFFSLFFLFY